MLSRLHDGAHIVPHAFSPAISRSPTASHLAGRGHKRWRAPKRCTKPWTVGTPLPARPAVFRRTQPCTAVHGRAPQAGPGSQGHCCHHRHPPARRCRGATRPPLPASQIHADKVSPVNLAEGEEAYDALSGRCWGRQTWCQGRDARKRGRPHTPRHYPTRVLETPRISCLACQGACPSPAAGAAHACTGAANVGEFVNSVGSPPPPPLRSPHLPGPRQHRKTQGTQAR